MPRRREVDAERARQHSPGLARSGACAHPLVLVAVATLIAYLVANLLSAIKHNEELAERMRQLESAQAQDRFRLDLAQGIARSVHGGAARPPAPSGAPPVHGGAARPAARPNAASGAPPVSGTRAPHPRGGVGWNGERAAELRGMCGTGRKGTMFAQELIYPRERYLGISSSNSPSDPNTIRYLLSLNNPEDDSVVSKGILQWMFSPPGTYPSSTEVHTLCTARTQETEEVDGGLMGFWNRASSGRASSGAQVSTEPLVRCGGGRVAVEVGSSIGMVSMYLAERGMRVYALDPVLPNVQRLGESACLNGVRRCLQHHAQQPHDAAAHACRNSSSWGPFSPGNITLVHAVADRSTGSSRMVRALAKNLAATNPKGSWASTNRGSSPWAGQVHTLNV